MQSDTSSETRKVISILFADLMGSTALQERLDPESVNRVMDAYYQAVRVPVEAADGTVVQLLGDGVLCAFGIPRIAEDDALRAVRAAMGIQEAFREFLHAQQWLTVPIGLRVAVNTGEVVVSDEHPAGIGDPLNVAARLQQEARDGEVLIGQATRRLVADAVTLERAGTFALKGRAETVTAYRVLSLERPTGTTAAFVGRAEELARLTVVYEAAVATPAARLAVLLGSPGLGKSRLIDEVGRRLADDAHLIAAHCDAAGGATFAPIAEALWEWLGSNPLLAKEGPGEVGKVGQGARSAIEAVLAADSSTDPSAEASAKVDRARLVAGISALLAGSPASPEETFFVIRRFLRALANEKPVVLVIDDLQWAEPLLLDLVEHLIQWGSGAPLFVAVGARPELRERRSSLATVGGLVSDVVTLSGLDAGAAMRLAANVIGAADLPAAVAAKVLATSEGNPLFVSELVRMLVDEGAIEMRGDRWTVGANLAALEMPPTIHALLAARIERLQPEERTVLERASVVGRHFSRGAVAALLGHNGSALDARFEALRRTELIEPDTGWLLGEPVLRFHHVLIRDAAYRRLLKGTRAELHERLANWIEAQGQEASEHDETIGRHLEQAHQLLREIGPLDASAKGLGKRAAQRLSAAGRRALEGDDVPVAADLLGRAVDRLDHDDPARADLALDWCEALLSAGDVGAAANAIAELGRFAGAASTAPTDLSDPSDPQLSRLRAWHTCFNGHLTVMTAPQELQATADAVAAAAAVFSRLGDAAGEAKAHFVHALALARLGKVAGCEAALDQALAAARRAGDRRRANTVLAIAPLAALWGPSPVTRASGRCLDVVRVLRITQGAPAVEAVALSCQGVLEALRGRTEAAHRMIASGREMVEELGIAQRLFETDVFAGFVAMLEGDASAAERTLRGAYDGLRDLGLGIDAARAAALLARALLAQERSTEAEALSHDSEALAGDDLKAAIAWRGVRAKALAKRGEYAEAIDLARAAVAIAATTDALLDHADARLALAAAFRAAGRSVEADAEDRHAVEIWEAKGATLLAERARRATTPAEPLVAAPQPRVAHAPRRRPVRPNFAIEEARRAEAALAARDAQALESLYRRDVEIFDHQFGVEYGHDAIVERVRLTIEESTDGAFRHEALATLGDFVALCRLHSTASGSVVYDVPFGATEVSYLLVIEADEQGCARRIDIFGEDALRDAVVRLYERHAALLPEGAARTRAAATAQSMAVLRSANADPKLLAPVLAPDIEGIDHRHLSNWSLHGAPAYLDHLRALHQVADDVDFRWEDVLALAPGALLTRNLHRGTERVGRGPYERCFLSLFVVGADGRFTRAEWFDDDREVEALARFEELVPGPVDGVGANDEVSRLVRRRVRPNAASALVKGIEAGFAARDRDAIEALLADPLHTVEHPTGSSYGREGQLESIDRMLRLPNLEFRMELLATLGDALCLARRRVTASGTAGGRFDVAAYEMDHIVLSEVDASGRLRLSEVFAADHLGDAVARSYERHAELLPAGPERDRAVAVAVTRARPGSLATHDPEGFAALLAPDFEGIDHRRLGSWTMRGAEAYLEHLRALHEVGDEMTIRPLDVLALEPEAILLRTMHSGTERRGGGTYERPFLVIWVHGADGRLVRAEWFDEGREADAVARFRALTADASDARATQAHSRRAVRANAATRISEGFVRTVAARDAVALESLLAEDLQFEHWPTGASYTGREFMATWRGAFKAEHLEFELEMIASLGERMALHRHQVSVEGVRDAGMKDFGRAEFDEIVVVEADEFGKCRRMDLYAPENLGDAVVRLYEGYAAQQSDGPARTRMETAARAVSTINGSVDLERMTAAYAPSLSLADHRVLATWSCESAAELMANFRHQIELAPDFAARIDHVLVLEPDALLARVTYFGTGQDSGGAFENRICVLYRFGNDGRFAWIDCYEAEHEAEALARFDALAARPREDSPGASPSPADRGFSNAASRLNERFARAWAERDWNTVSGAYVAGHHVDDRRRLMQMRLPDGDARAALRFLFDVPGSRWVVTPLATRGEHLVVSRYVFEGTAGADAGPIAIDYLALDQTDADGRFIETVLFDPDDLDAAYAELDRCYGAGDGRADVTWPQAHRLAAALPRGDVDACRAMLAPGFRVGDHRKLGWGDTLRDADTFLQAQLALTELSPDWRYRIDHHRARGRVSLGQQAQVGTREGGPFENPFLVVTAYDEAGLVLGFDIYDVDQLEQARARFEELAVPVGATDRFANAASRMAEKQAALFAAKDWQAFRQLSCERFRYFDRRRIVLLELDRDQHLAFLREAGEGRSIRNQVKVLATRGERLALWHYLVEFTDDDIGPSELEFVTVTEVDSHGLLAAAVRFEPDDVAAAYAELDARYEAGEAATPSNNWLSIAGFVRAVERRDWNAVRALCRDDFVEQDHRGLALLGGTEGADAWVGNFRTLVELAPDTVYRAHHVLEAERGYFVHGSWYGTREGGPYELQVNAVLELDNEGRFRRADIYDDAVTDAAFARLAELDREAVARTAVAGFRETLATRCADRFWSAYQRAFDTDEWETLREGCAPGAVFDDRRRLVLVSGGIDLMIASLQERARVGARPRGEVVALGGERVLVQRIVWSGGPSDGPFEIEYLGMIECDADGTLTAALLFDTDDERAAQQEAWTRWAAIEPDMAGPLRLAGAYVDAFNAKSVEAFRVICADDFVCDDHRFAGVGRIEGLEPYLNSVAALWEMTPVTFATIDWEPLALAPNAVVVSSRRAGTVPGGGDFESLVVSLFVVEKGRATRIEMFDVDARAEALARFEELRGSSDEAQGDRPPLPRPVLSNVEGGGHRGIDAPPERGDVAAFFANSAVRAMRRVVVAQTARDIEAIAATFADDFRGSDRRSLLRADTTREEYLEAYRSIVEMTSEPPVGTVMATRGARLALVRWLWRGAGGDVGPSEIEMLHVIEVDDRGDHVAVVTFDATNIDAAYAELDARYEAGEAVTPSNNWLSISGFVRAVERRDWDAVRALCRDDFFERDHRGLALLGGTEGADAWVDNFRTLVELAPDTVYRAHHVVEAERGYFVHGSWYGTREGGPYELQVNAVLELDNEGRFRRADIYDDAVADAAFARLAELGVDRPPLTSMRQKSTPS